MELQAKGTEGNGYRSEGDQVLGTVLAVKRLQE